MSEYVGKSEQEWIVLMFPNGSKNSDCVMHLQSILNKII